MSRIISRVPFNVARLYEEPEYPYFDNITYYQKKGSEHPNLISKGHQNKVFDSKVLTLEGVTEGEVVVLADRTNGKSARNFTLFLLKEWEKLGIDRVTWVKLDRKFDQPLPNSYELESLDILVIDNLYAKHSASTRADKARDLIRDGNFITILISSEGDPMLFSQELGIPVDYPFMLKHYSVEEI